MAEREKVAAGHRARTGTGTGTGLGTGRGKWLAGEWNGGVQTRPKTADSWHTRPMDLSYSARGARRARSLYVWHRGSLLIFHLDDAIVYIELVRGSSHQSAML